MKYVRLMGGLGNQMFQYAFARSFQLRKNEKKIMLDTSFLKVYNSSFTDYYLDVFNIKLETSSESPLFKKDFKNKIIERIFLRLKLKSVRREKSLVFDEENFRDDWKLIIGYFQSEKYFKDFRQELLKDFSLKKEMTSPSIKIQKSIQQNNSVSIHIRRGDYITNHVANRLHGFCGLDYYRKAIDHIRSVVDKPMFYIFSNDCDWAKENLKLEECIFVDHNTGITAYEDLILMSKCKHNIIANSSFSWWGAWLNDYEEKIVIAPKNWFASKSYDSTTIICDNWIRL